MRAHDVAGGAIHRLEIPAGDRAVVLGQGGTVHELRLGMPGQGAAMPVLAHGTLADVSEDPLFAGKLLFPWNDRLPGGRWAFEGQRGAVVPNVPEDGSAIHGFLYRQDLAYVASGREGEGAFLVLEGRIGSEDEPGWPFPLRLQVTFRLFPGSFHVAFQVENLGDRRAPFALGWHPYFTLGGSLADWVLTHGGETFVPVGPDLLPTGGLEPVAGTTFDFRTGSPLGDRELDVALAAPTDGCWRLSAPGGPELEIEADPGFFGYTQFYIPPDRRAIALEPVTSPTDALNRPHLGLQVLEPGASRCGAVAIRRIR